MSNRTLGLDDNLYNYLLTHSLREPDLFKQLRIETAQDEWAQMQIAPEQGQFMGLLVKLINAKNIIEVGTFTGYSSLWLASQLPDDGHLICCDVSKTWTDIAKRYWEKAQLDSKITLFLQPAVQTLDELLIENKHNTFDFAFIDADKVNYDAYYERCLKLIHSKGLIAIDNMLWGGAVADPTQQDSDTQAIRALMQKIHNDSRVEISLIPIADGLLLVHKK
jgi:caffeoyl-CoA O-methyltransferase